jgi:Lar family restriction alleviation protein
MGDLKPCPFCGGEAVVLGYEPMRRAYEVCCTHCNVRLFGPEQKSRDEMWNRRAVEAKLEADNKRLRDAIKLAIGDIDSIEVEKALIAAL